MSEFPQQPPPQPSADASTPIVVISRPLASDVVCAFLAHRDVPCPGCGYNLRGVGEPTCPECGRSIELTVSGPGRSRGYLLFVLLALGWVLAAGTMNSVRGWGTARSEASVTTPVMLAQFLSAPPARTQTWTSSATSGSGRFSITTSGAVSVRTIRAPARTGFTWSNVSRATWINIGWWTGLGVIALSTLVVALVRRRRFDRHAPPRGTMIAACALFALYAGYHAVMFTREFI